MRAVLPKDMPIMPVGSITPNNRAKYWAAGANGFGLGSALYEPGAPPASVADNAKRFMDALLKLACDIAHRGLPECKRV